MPDDLVARLEGKSSLGRLGLLIHSTAGYVDAGFDGQITLELSNVANLPITLYPGMKIGQVSFLRMTTPADVPYGSGALGSKYKGQQGPTPSQYWKNFQLAAALSVTASAASIILRRCTARSSVGTASTCSTMATRSLAWKGRSRKPSAPDWNENVRLALLTGRR